MRLSRTTLLFLALVTGLAAVSSGFAQKSGPVPNTPGQPLTLDQAIAYGLEHNRALQAAVQDVNAVRQQVRQAQADFLPRLDASYLFRHLSDQPYVNINNSSRFPSAHSTANRWQVELTQPLFTGFGLSSQLKLSRMDVSIAEYHLEEARLNLVRDIKHAFWQTLLAERLLQVAKDSVRSLEIHRHNAEANFQQGLAAQNDVLKAEVALAQARQRERSTAKQLVVLRSRLNQLLDLDLQATVALSEKEDTATQTIPELDTLYRTAEKQRPEYLALQTSARQADEGANVARSRYWPHLSAFAQYYREGEDFAAGRNDYTNNDNAAVGLRVDWNWFEGGRVKAEVKEWRYRRQAIEERGNDLKQQIRLQVEDAYEALQVARDNIATAQVAVRQAEENERMTSLQYREQMVIFLEVLNAQVFVSESYVDYYQALYGYRLALADLDRAVGRPVEGIALSFQNGTEKPDKKVKSHGRK